MFTFPLILLIVAFIAVILSAMGKCPVWIPVLLLCVVELYERLK